MEIRIKATTAQYKPTNEREEKKKKEKKNLSQVTSDTKQESVKKAMN